MPTIKGNFDEFISLLYLAKGNYTFNKFARLCNIAPSYLSRIINKKINALPQPEILSRIALHSQNEKVTYNSLMITAGYVAPDHSDELQEADDDKIERILDWATMPENLEYIEFAYKLQKIGFPKEMLSSSKLVVDINNTL